MRRIAMLLAITALLVASRLRARAEFVVPGLQQLSPESEDH